MGFVQNDVFMRKHDSNSPISHMWTSSSGGMILPKLAKKLKLPTCASIFVHMVSDLEIQIYGFCLEYGKLSKTEAFFKIRIGLGDMGGALTRICPN
jgi:hypothetical protein